MYDSHPTPAEPPGPRVGGSERRANFVAHMGVVVGAAGTAALAEEGAHAHDLSTELQSVARGNTAADARRFAHVRWRHAAVTVGLLVLFVAGLAMTAERLGDVSVAGVAVALLAGLALFVLRARWRRKNAWY